MEKKIDETTKYWYRQENTNEMICNLSKRMKEKSFRKEEWVDKQIVISIKPIVLLS